MNDLFIIGPRFEFRQLAPKRDWVAIRNPIRAWAKPLASIGMPSFPPRSPSAAPPCGRGADRARAGNFGERQSLQGFADTTGAHAPLIGNYRDGLRSPSLLGRWYILSRPRGAQKGRFLLADQPQHRFWNMDGTQIRVQIWTF